MEKTKIEWCDSSWNPVTGCYHDCPYCYARRLAIRYRGCDDAPETLTSSEIVELDERLKITRKNGKTVTAAYPFGFTPTFHKYRLEDLQRKKFGKTIFVCSSADLFGDWVPDEWIEQVFDVCLDAPNHRYLFLTKNPARYIRLSKVGKLPKRDNFWYGSTVTRRSEIPFLSNTYHTFVSAEPLLEPIQGSFIVNTEWVIMGAETGNRVGKVVPEKKWIEDIMDELAQYRRPAFMKDSLIPIWGDHIITQFPWRNDK